MDLPAKSFLELARKVGVWAALALALIALLVFRFDVKLDAIAEKLAAHVGATDRQVRLLELMCVAVVDTDTEKLACRQAAGK